MLTSFFKVKMEKCHLNILFHFFPGRSEGISTSCINETILPNSRSITRDLRINLLPFTQQDRARGGRDVVGEEMLQEKREEVVVEMAVKHLQGGHTQQPVSDKTNN